MIKDRKIMVRDDFIAFAHSGDVEQSILLNNLANYLEIACGDEYEKQICAIGRALVNGDHQKGIDFIKNLASVLEAIQRDDT